MNIGLVHFRSAKSSIKIKSVNHGFNLVVPVGDDEAHAYNLLYNYLTNPAFEYPLSCIVAFGGYMPVLGAPILAKLFNIPLISLLRGNDFDVSLFLPRKREILFYALNISKTICTVSLEQTDKIKMLVGHNDIRYIPNGIKLDDWVPHKSEMERAIAWKNQHVNPVKKVIGIFGHLKQKKGIDFFIDSIERSGHADTLFLLITGEIYPEIAQKLEVSGIAFHISPFMDRYELLAWYPVCDIVAIPSFYDGMPNVLLEAGALGIASIAANVGGMKDILKNGEHGFTFHAGDEDGCTRAIKNFASMDSGSLKKMGENIKQLIAEKYNSDVEIQRYLKVFNDLVKSEK